MIRNGILLLGALAVAACSPAAEEAEPPDTSATTAAEPTGQPAPEVFAATAWRAVAEDGARYTTYLDAGGTYRDLRNGDPWQTGSWTFTLERKTKRLCFTPDGESVVQRCWEPGRMSGETLDATSDSGTRIELERIEYAPPEDTEEPG